MQLKKNGIDFQVPDDQITSLVLKALTQDENTMARMVNSMPSPVGEYWPGQGGVNAGLIRDNDGKVGYLIIGPRNETEKNFADSAAWAASQTVDGHNDFRSISRREARLAMANVPELFKDRWYWTGERHPVYEDYAYAQHFDDGRQYGFGTVRTCFACAVRVIPI